MRRLLAIAFLAFLAVPALAQTPPDTVSLAVPLNDVGGNPLPPTSIGGCAVVARSLDAAGNIVGPQLALVSINAPAPGSVQPIGPRCPAAGSILWAAWCWDSVGLSVLGTLKVSCAAPSSPTVTSP